MLVILTAFIKLISLYTQDKRRSLLRVTLLFTLAGFFLQESSVSSEVESPIKLSNGMLRLGQLKELSPVHEIHREKKITSECSLCHKKQASKSKMDIPEMSVCLSCHKDLNKNVPQLFCENCHLGAMKIISGIEKPGAVAIRSKMANLDCVACHDPKNKFQVSPKVCLCCHGESQKDKMVQLQKEYTEKLTNVENDYKNITDFMKSVQNKQNTLIN